MARVNHGRVAGVLIAAVILMAMFWSPTSATHTPHLEKHTPKNTKAMEATGNDIDARVDVGHKVFTMRANYYAFSERDHPYTSRVWVLISPYTAESEGRDELARVDWVQDNLTRMFRTGDVQLIIMTPRTAYLIRQWPRVETAFEHHFCRVEPRPDLYDRWGVNIYTYYENQPADCTTELDTGWGV